MAINIGINGFGRIGRITTRALLQKDNINIVAINDLMDPPTRAHLFQYDSAQGRYAGEVDSDDDHLIIDDQKIQALSEKNPTELPWEKLGVDVVLESTGIFRKKDQAAQHLEAGAGKVVISAPAKGDVKTIVLGVNGDLLEGDDQILSNASCTTNSLAPMVKILNDQWGIESGFMTTVHAYTADQNLQDAPHHKDLRRARAAAQNIVPTTTGAAKAVGEVLPEIKGKLNGMAMRVPTIVGSITDLTCTLNEEVSADEINRAFQEAAQDELQGILQYTEDPLVSSDIIGNPHSCIFDAQSTDVIGNLVKVVGWYDNEAGYSHRLADLIETIG